MTYPSEPGAPESAQAVGSSRRRVFRVLALLVWAAILAFCLYHRDALTAEAIAARSPDRLLPAALAVLGLFALKSVSFVLYSGILYTVSGLLFPLPAAIAVNACGTLLMVSIPYLLGRKTGGGVVDRLTTRYTKLRSLRALRRKNDFLFVYLVRAVGRLPSDFVSLYMGAVHADVKQYLAGSLLGMLPHVITFSVMGGSLDDVTSPAFLISLAVELGIFAVSVGWTLWRRKRAVS